MFEKYERMAKPGMETRIIVVDENSSDRALTIMALRRELGEVEVVECTCALHFADSLSGEAPVAVISEHNLSWGDGLAVLETAKGQFPGTRTILFTKTSLDALAPTSWRIELDAYVRKRSAGWLELPDIVSGAMKDKARGNGTAMSPVIPSSISYPGVVRPSDYEDLPVGHFHVGVDGTINNANSAFAALLGRNSTAEIDGQPLDSLIDANGLTAALWSGERQDQLDVQSLRPDGSRGWLCLSLWPSETPSSLGSGQGVAWDISRLKGLEEALANGEANGNGAAGGHETKAQGMADASSESGSEAGSGTENGQKRWRDVDTVVFFEELVAGGSGTESPADRGDRPMMAVNLESAILEAMEHLKNEIREHGVRVRTGSLPTLLLDRHDIVHLLERLFTHAISHRGNEPPIITVRAELREGYWLLSVQDNGRGIDPKLAGELLNYVRPANGKTKPAGGLAICSLIARSYGGDMWIHTDPAHGTCFYVALCTQATDPENVDLTVVFDGETLGQISVSTPSSKQSVARAALDLEALRHRIGEQPIKDIQFLGADVVNILI